ncbi:DUF6531 domain-containing protein [Listeria grandensis]|uniref:DUF6531 domain-containing protein n=1 Tax=Listeria grandensis TaxID=1494963 RepID=UPI00164E202C|nr:DUF6531 domain-containing protein [Listeria grandensis]MBC6314039.1 hypothetical protein [Listeria grandensis]
MKKLKQGSKRMKQVLFIGLSALLFVSGIQLGSVTTFAASVATVGQYANVDVTQNNSTPNTIENAPANEVAAPSSDSPVSERLQIEELESSYQAILDDGFSEDLSMRTETSKTFVDATDTVERTIISETPIHFEDEKGNWTDYDSTLKPVNNGLLQAFGAPKTYETTDEQGAVQLQTTIDATHPIEIETALGIIQVVPIGGNFTGGQVAQDSMLFKNAYAQTDISLSLSHESLTITGRSYDTSAPSNFDYQLNLPVETEAVAGELDQEVAIIDSETKEKLFSLFAPLVHDAENNDYVESTVIQEDNIVHIQLDNNVLAKGLKAYPIDFTQKAWTHVVDGNVRVYAMRAANPDNAYNASTGYSFPYFYVGGEYGETSGGVYLGGTKGVIRGYPEGGRNWRQLLGNNREVVSATLYLGRESASQHWTEFYASRVTGNYGNPEDLTWRSWSNSGVNAIPINNSNFWIGGENNGSGNDVKVNITEAMQAWYGTPLSQAPDYGILLQSVHESDKAHLFTTETHSIQPFMEIVHIKEEPIADDLPLKDTKVSLRAFTSNDTQGVLKFQALGIDGVARPGSVVEVEIVEKNTPTTKVYESGAIPVGTGYRTFPYYEGSMYPTIDKTQKYYGLQSNWQAAGYAGLATDYKANTVYQVKFKTTVFNTDGSVKETTEWTNGDTFQTYKVTGWDTIFRVNDFYGLTYMNTKIDNNMRSNYLIEGNTMFLRNPTKNEGKAYHPQPLAEGDMREIDWGLVATGKHCEFGYEPINLNTGNFYYNNQDASWFDFDDQSVLTRHYNSLISTIDSPFGRGWESSYNYRLSQLADGTIVFGNGTGQRFFFHKTGNGYDTPFGTDYTIEKIQTASTVKVDADYYDKVDDVPKQKDEVIQLNSFIVKDTKGQAYYFNETGTLQKIVTDRYGHEVTFTYDDKERLIKTTTSSGKTVGFSYANNDYHITTITLPDNNTLKYEYDESGNLTAFIDQEGYKLQYKYEDINNPNAMTSYKSRMSGNPTLIENEYDTKGRVVKQTDAENRVVTFEYQENATIATNYDGKQEIVYFDENKRTTEKINLDGTSKVQAYDGSNNMTALDTPSEEPVSYTYDANGNNTSETRADGKVKTYMYNAQHMPIEITNFDGEVTHFTYDSYDNMTGVQYSDGSSMTWIYNTDGQKISETDKNGNTTTYTYQSGNKVNESNPLGSKQITYDANSMIQSETDALGNTSTYNRNKRGELTSYVRPNGTQAFQYDADGQKIWETDANGNAKTYSYDGIGRLLSETDSYGTETYAYDVNGNQTSEINELGEETNFTYDSSNRLIQTTYADGSHTQNVYDSAGHLITSIDQLGFETHYEYDFILNQKTKETAPNGAVTSYSYDTLGNLLETIFPDGSIETNSYNGLNQLIEKTDKNGLVTSYKYDYNGNTIETQNGTRISSKTIGTMDTEVSEHDALNFETARTYNAALLVTKTTMRNGATQSYQYDGEYNIIATIDSAGNTVHKTYDGNGNMISETDQIGNTTTYTYTARNQLATTTYPDSGVVQNQYDAKGQLVTTVDQLGNEVASIYNTVGRVEKSIDARGFENTNEYDAKGQLIKSTDALNQSTTYEYDAIGNQIKIIAPTGVTTYNTYNQLGQLLESSDNFDRFTKYEYDVMGNQTKTTNWKGETTSATFNEYNEKTTSTDMRGNVTTYTYDDSSQLTLEQDAKGNEKAVTYNGIGQTLQSMGTSCLPCGTTDTENTTYSYDLIGNPVATTDQDGNVTTFIYDAKGQLVETTNALGNVMKTTYTPTGLIASSTDANGGMVQNTYDLKGQLIQVIDPEGNKTQYEYDENGNQILAIDPLGYGVQTDYDALNRPVSTTDKKNNTTTTEYNVWNQVAKLESPNDISERYEYDAKGFLTKSWDGRGNVTTNTYNDFDQLIESKQPNGLVVTTTYNEFSDVIEVKNNQDATPSEVNTYDQFGQLISKLDGNKNETQYEYNSKGQIIKTIAANGNIISYTYDENGRVETMTDIRGNVTAYMYDALGQVLAVKYPSDKTFTYMYDALGQVLAVKYPSDKTFTYMYDGNGNLLTETNPLTATTEYKYNKNNQTIETTNALGQTQTTTYDERGAIASESDAKGNEVTYAYDANGNKTIEVDASGNTTAFDYDANNRMTTVRNRKDAETKYEYDANSNLIKATNASGNSTKFEYDKNNNQTKVITADQKVQSFQYDLKGNEISQKNQDGRSITYKYDALNNQVYKGFDDKQYQYSYNTENQVTSVTDTKSQATLTYNQYGDLISYTDQNQNMVQYQYDSIGRRVGLTYPDGIQTKYEYDLNDNLVKVSTGNDITNYTYDILGNLLSTILPNGSVTSYSYDANNQIEQLKTVSKNGTIMSNIEYAYDERGNISSENATIDGINTLKTYAYDEEEQLLSSTHVSGSTTKEYSYLYDQVGNKLAATETIAGIVTNKQYKFDNKNALIEEKGGLGVDYSYDATGNVSQKRYANGVVEKFAYDTEGMLLSVQSTTGKTINYSYDGFGNRTQKTEKTSITSSEDSGFLSFLKSDDTYNEDYNQELVSQTTNEQLNNLRQTISDHLDTYDQTCPVEDEDAPKESLETINYINDINREFTEVLQTKNADGNTIHTYTYGVQRINDTKKDEAPTYYAYDARGSVIGQETIQKPEQLSFKATYNDFGKTNVKMDNQYGYNAESHDFNGTQYLRVRYYDNKSGTFGQQDSYLGDTRSPASQNRFAYTQNNPTNANDPSGHKATRSTNTSLRPAPKGKKCLAKDGKTLIDCDDTPSISKPVGGGTPLSNGGSDGGYKLQEYYEGQGYESREQKLAREAALDAIRTEEMTNEAISRAKAWGLNIDGLLDGLTGEALLRRVIEIIKLCDALDAGTLNLSEAQARADSFKPTFGPNPDTSTGGTTKNGITIKVMTAGINAGVVIDPVPIEKVIMDAFLLFGGSLATFAGVIGTLPLWGILGLGIPLIAVIGSVAFVFLTPAPASTIPRVNTLDGLSDIMDKYKNYECIQAAAAAVAFLKNLGEEFEQISMKFPLTSNGHVISNSMEAIFGVGSSQSIISTNGYHTGVLYKGIVFCNVHKAGMPLKAWLNDFVGPGAPTITPGKYQSLKTVFY